MVIQVGSTFHPARTVANIFGNWINCVDHMFKILIRMRALAYVEITRFLRIKHLLSHAGYLLVSNFYLFMAVYTSQEESRTIYVGVCTVERH
jgi:hypothetical protein